MTFKRKGGTPREGAPQNAAILTRCGIENSDFTGKIQPSIATKWLAQRTGLSVPTAAAIAAANCWGEAR